MTVDAYMDHPSSGMAIIGRILNWQSADKFKDLGQPSLGFGMTSGNKDSMTNQYTGGQKVSHNDSYPPNDEGGTA